MIWGVLTGTMGRMDFIRRVATTGNVELPDAAKKEVGLAFYYDIVQR